MRHSRKKIKIGILGCGAIGSRIAQCTLKELRDLCQLSGLYDNDPLKLKELEQNLLKENSNTRNRMQGVLRKRTLSALINNCDLMIEAVNAQNTSQLIRQALEARKDVLAMSVGQLLNAQDIFSLAEKNHCSLLLPSGAVAGIDAIKAAGLVNISKISLTTRKPLSGFLNNAYIKKQGMDLSQIQKETIIFEGDVDTAVKWFPQNINVAATLALASQAKSKITIRIMTSPKYQTNSHEVDVRGDFGRMVSRTENVVCPDNPKTSYLAVLSAMQTLKDYCRGIRVGT